MLPDSSNTAAIQENAALLRVVAFTTVFILFAFAEWKFPRRSLTNSRFIRCYSNLGILGIDSLAAC